MFRVLKDLLITVLFAGVLIGSVILICKYALPDEYLAKIEERISIEKENLGFYEDSKISGEEYHFDVDYYPYYGMLDATQQALYKQIYANAFHLEKTFVPCVEVNIYDIKQIVDAVYYDHPELFWMENSYIYKYTDDKICVHMTLSFNETADDIEFSKEQFQKSADEIISAASEFASDYEKERYVYQEFIRRIAYQEDAKVNQSAYSALVYEKSVCAGYTRAFQYILIELEIPTYYCLGETDQHVWNIVKLEDEYYYVDVSRDAEQGVVGRYFNRSEEDLRSTHKRGGYSFMLPRCHAGTYQGYTE